MRQALGLAAPLMLALAAPVAVADSYYVGVTGGYSEIRNSRFAHGEDGTRANVDYEGGETLALTLGRASEGGRFNGRSELEVGFQRDTADSILFDSTTNEEPVIDDDPTIDGGEPDDNEGRREDVSDVSGTADVIYAFYNAMGDLRYSSKLSLTAGFGLGLGRVEFDTISARGRGLLVDDSDTGWGWQVSAGVNYRLLDNIDVELLYRFRGWEALSPEPEDGPKTDVSFSSNNFLGGLRVRF